MAMSVKQWEQEVKLLGLDQKAEILAGLKALESWEVFRSHFKWTGVFSVMAIIRLSLR